MKIYVHIMHEWQNQKSSGLGRKLTERAVLSDKICQSSSEVRTKKLLRLAKMIEVGVGKTWPTGLLYWVMMAQ